MLQPQGPVLIMGDFNAHLGVAGCCRGVGKANAQGLMLQECLHRSSLFPVYLGELANGPTYTFFRGE